MTQSSFLHYTFLHFQFPVYKQTIYTPGSTIYLELMALKRINFCMLFSYEDVQHLKLGKEYKRTAIGNSNKRMEHLLIFAK